MRCESVIVRRSVTKSADGLVETEPKSGRARRVDLDPRTMAILEAHRSGQVRFLDSELIFGHEIHGGFLDPDVVSKAWAVAVAESDLPAISFHGARHTHAANLLRSRVPANVVQQRLGHATAGFTLSTYGHLIPDQGAEAAAVFAEAVFGS